MQSNLRDLPVLPLRQSVLFPGTMLPVAVARPRSLALLDALTPGDEILFFAQRDAGVEDPTEQDLFDYGTRGRVVKATRAGDRGVQLVVEGLARVQLVALVQSEPHLRARYEELPGDGEASIEVRARAHALKKAARRAFELAMSAPAPLLQLLDGLDEPARLVDLVASTLDLETADKVRVLAAADLERRMELILELVRGRLERLEVSRHIDAQVKEELTKNQREHYLRQQMKAIREELGEGESAQEDDLAALTGRLGEAGLSEAARAVADKELRRLRGMASATAEYSVARTYLEWLADLPWAKSTTDTLELGQARRALDEKHYGLESVKKRIVEFLAVRKLKADQQGPILCLVGPPGVGKTSLAQSVAESLGRKLQRISLGGVRDEAEIRGHRRTYVGAQPGRIVQGLKKAGTRNPLFVLDEIDKLSHDHHGDPSSALLEVLDPEQNYSFSDHYLEVPFDLSRAMFVATANRLDPIPPALRDRMEVIEIPGYTHDEKRHIARAHLLPKVLAAHGLSAAALRLEDDALDAVIAEHTREAGVRSLERRLTTIARGVAVQVAEGRQEQTVVTRAALADYLGPARYENERAGRTDQPGVAVGLAWTEVGGDILFIEATKMGGHGKLTLTGQLGEVMKESVQAAQSYLRARSPELGVLDSFWAQHDIHVHLPAGAVPKDGPSAGIAVVTALASLITETRVKSDVAMTGELTLRGNVLPVGGIKEKVLAAHRAGVTTLLLPERNRKDLVEVPEEVKRALTVHFVHRVEEVLDLALERPLPRLTPAAPPPRAPAPSGTVGARA